MDILAVITGLVAIGSLLVTALIIYIKTPFGKLAELEPEYYENTRIVSLASTGSLGFALFSMGFTLLLQLRTTHTETIVDLILYMVTIAFIATMIASGVVIASKSLGRLNKVIDEVREGKVKQKDK